VEQPTEENVNEASVDEETSTLDAAAESIAKKLGIVDEETVKNSKLIKAQMTKNVLVKKAQKAALTMKVIKTIIIVVLVVLAVAVVVVIYNMAKSGPVKGFWSGLRKVTGHKNGYGTSEAF
jgi:uncharacterized membrane protein